MMTFFTEPRICLRASSALVKSPVDSTTTCTPSEGQSIFAGILLFENFDCLAVDDDAVLTRLYVPFQVTEHRVILQKVRESFRIGNVIYRDDFNVVIPNGRTIEISTNATETVNAYFDCHTAPLFFRGRHRPPAIKIATWRAVIDRPYSHAK